MTSGLGHTLIVFLLQPVLARLFDVSSSVLGVLLLIVEVAFLYIQHVPVSAASYFPNRKFRPNSCQIISAARVGEKTLLKQVRVFLNMLFFSFLFYVLRSELTPQWGSVH